MKNILRNKKGFTLLEILVTVGIVGVLSAVAVPAYNQYKRGTIETAVESDIGNFQKAYMAYNAVNGDYCASFLAAGIKVRDDRNYKKKGIIGFEVINSACTGLTKADVQVVPDGGSCAGAEQTAGTLLNPQPDSKADCEATTLAVQGTWTATPPGSLTTCELDIDQLVMGATTNVSGINKGWAINEEGKIIDNSISTPGDVTCPALGANFNDPTVVVQ